MDIDAVHHEVDIIVPIQLYTRLKHMTCPFSPFSLYFFPEDVYLAIKSN